MKNLSKILFITSFLAIVCLATLTWNWQTATAQTKPLTYPDIVTALNAKLPAQFKSKSQFITWLISQIKERKIDKPLNESREEDLRQAGATDELIEAIRQNSPPIPKPKPTATTVSTPLPTPKPTPKPDATFYIKQGNDLRDKGSYELSFKEYNKAIELDLQNADAFLSRGMAYHYWGDVDQAFSDYRTAIRLRPELGSEDRMKCLLYSKESSKPETGIEVCTMLIMSQPDFSLAYNIRGLAKLNKNDFSESLADLKKAITLNSEFPMAYSNQGLLELTIASFGFGLYKVDYERGLTSMGKALELNPKFAEAYLVRGKLYEKKDEFEKSIADINKYFELSPRALANCRRCYPISYDDYLKKFGSKTEKSEYSQRLKMILSFFDNLIQRNPESVYNYLGRNEAISGFSNFDYNLSKNLEKKNVEEIIKYSKPQNAQEYFVRASLTAGPDIKDAKSISDLDKAISLDKEFASAYLLRGMEKRDDFDVAIKDIDEALRLYPGFINDYFYYAVYRDQAARLYKQKQYEKALVITTKLIETPISTDIYFLREILEARANLYEKLGRKDLAQADRERAKKLK